MVSRYKIYIVATLILKHFKNIQKLAVPRLFAKSRARDFMILTKNALERTTRKKDGAGAVFARNARFFPKMRSGAGDDKIITHTAKADIITSVDITFSRTKATDHKSSMPRITTPTSVTPSER